jgi:hypothetical protein
MIDGQRRVRVGANSTCQSARLSASHSAYQSTCLPNHQSTCLPICLSVLLIRLPACPSTCLAAYLWTFLLI